MAVIGPFDILVGQDLFQCPYYKHFFSFQVGLHRNSISKSLHSSLSGSTKNHGGIVDISLCSQMFYFCMFVSFIYNSTKETSQNFMELRILLKSFLRVEDFLLILRFTSHHTSSLNTNMACQIYSCVQQN